MSLKFYTRPVVTKKGEPCRHDPMTQTANVIFQIRQNQISRTWLQVDHLGLLQQIGGVAI
ncbi:hypothetical protein [Undibacterium sp. TJN19]|uniref:hypothetical protein n=1 Tax=Undibacterium sp. TJN19 TaxID=3413055 RepID=UPI003BF38DE7